MTIYNKRRLMNSSQGVDNTAAVSQGENNASASSSQEVSRPVAPVQSGELIPLLPQEPLKDAVKENLPNDGTMNQKNTTGTRPLEPYQVNNNNRVTNSDLNVPIDINGNVGDVKFGYRDGAPPSIPPGNKFVATPSSQEDQRARDYPDYGLLLNDEKELMHKKSEIEKEKKVLLDEWKAKGKPKTDDDLNNRLLNTQSKSKKIDDDLKVATRKKEEAKEKINKEEEKKKEREKKFHEDL